MPKKLLYTVLIEGEYFPTVFFTSEKEAIDWCDESGYTDEEVDVLKMVANYKTSHKRIRTVP